MSIHKLIIKLEQIWYKKETPHRWLSVFLCYLSYVYQFVAALRKKWIKPTFRASCPVIVVGNLTVGGTGKTPFIMAMAAYLKQGGYRPGIVSRGYGGRAPRYPLHVTDTTSPEEAGDEAVMLAYRTQCPVIVAPQRVKAIQHLEKHFDCNIILSDDGLQHWAMHRDIEILVIDGERRFGNERCLPAGPLREPLARYETVDFRVLNGKIPPNPPLTKGGNGALNRGREYTMQIQPECFVHLTSGKQMALDGFKSRKIHVVTGIGNPQRFFDMLTAMGLKYDTRIFPDHHPFSEEDLHFSEKVPKLIVMTEKDAVKCRSLTSASEMYYLKVSAELDKSFKGDFLKKLNQIRSQKG